MRSMFSDSMLFASMNANTPSSTTDATSDTMTLVLPQCPIAWPLLNVVAAEDRP